MTYLSPREAAAHLGFSERTLERKRVDGEGPKFVRLGRRRLAYRMSDIEEWAAARTFPHRAAELAQRAVPPPV